MLSDSTTDHGLRYVEMDTPNSLPASPKPMDPPPRDQSASTERPFDIVTRKLWEIGAISIEDFLSSSSESPPLRVSPASLARRDIRPISSNVGRDASAHVSGSPEGEDEARESISPAVAPLSERNMNGDPASNFPLTRDNAISRLHQTCIHAFGLVDPLKYEFVEENGQRSKQCILTITLSEGRSRSYKSEAAFLRRADAKARVATLAVQMGALDFILEGNSHSERQPTSLLGVVQVGTTSPDETRVVDQTSPEGQIERCLVEWRAGKVSAEWIGYNDSRVVGQYGAALRIKLTDHSFRVYSCDSSHKSELSAKAACAQKALNEGVIDYIKSGNGQKEPTQPLIEDMEPELFDQQRSPPKGKTRPMTLQAYYESLPRPFPESFGTKTASEINAPSYINTLLQSARGGRLKYNFHWIADKGTSLLGCLLRLESGDVTKTYFVDCLFQKRNDAKSAACLLALSQGLGDYIRLVKEAMDANFTPEMRKIASEKFIFALNTECSKVRQGNRLNFTFWENVDAFGASLEIDISSNPERPDIRRWTVPAEYRSKSDAKLAVCYHAISEGAIEVLQFRGASPPPDHTSYWDAIHGKGTCLRVAKRKSAETEVVGETLNQPKKRKKEGQKAASIPSGSISTGGRTSSAAQNSSSGTPMTPKRLGGKRPLNTRLQVLNGSYTHDSPRDPTGGQSQPRSINAEMKQGPDNFPVPQSPYYPPANHSPPHYPFSPPSGTLSPMYYQTPTQSPIAFATYHPHSTMPEQMISHTPPMYHSQAYVPTYPQPAISPYYTMPSPYHSPYGYGNPMYLPPTPDGRMMDYRQAEMYHPPLPTHVPLHPMSPPSTPLRPQRIRRIDRNTALSPLKMADNLAELEEIGAGNVEKGVSKGTDDEGWGRMETPGGSREEDGLEPGELTEGEEEEEISSDRYHQVLERRASMP